VRDVLLYVVTVINLLSMFAMIGGILMHSGRGGGLSDMFGGGMSTSLGGSTVVERNLDRLTVITGVIFIFTTVLLALRLD
jgi:preprotein translocase subunit SecG